VRAGTSRHQALVTALGAAVKESRQTRAHLVDILQRLRAVPSPSPETLGNIARLTGILEEHDPGLRAAEARLAKLARQGIFPSGDA
jgi:hypothetical protein